MSSSINRGTARSLGSLPAGMSSIKTKVANRVGDVREHFEETGDRIKILMTPLQHTRMLTFVCFVDFVLLLVAISSNRFVWAHNAYNDNANPHYNVGLWKVDFGAGKENVCSDWPEPEDQKVCDNVKAVRAMLVLAIISNFLGIIGGTIRTHTGSQFWPVQTIYPLIASIVFTLLAFIVWQAGAHEPLEDDLAEYVNATITKPKTYTYYSTLGYSYGIMLWCWTWPLSILAVKVLLPMLEFEADETLFDAWDHSGHNHRARAGSNSGAAPSNI